MIEVESQAAKPAPSGPKYRTFCIYNRDVSPLDMDNVDRRTTAILMDNCTSDDWHAVIKRITYLKQITSLTATRCGLDDLQIHPLYAMEQLKKLVLDGNELRSGCGYWTTGTKELYELSLANNPLNDAEEDMEVFYVLRTLLKLKVINVPMPKLKSLGMGLIEELTDEVCERVLANAPILYKLEITSTKLSYLGILHILETKKNLKHLAFGKCKAAVECIEIIAEKLPGLMHFNLLECGVQDKHVPAIVRMKQLTYLGLESNQLTDEGVQLISGNLKELKELNLGKNNFTDKGMATLANLTNLIRLSTIGCDGTYKALVPIASSLVNLEELWINNSTMTDNVAKLIAQRLRKLVKLFASSSGMTEAQILIIARGLPKLDSLVVRTNKALTWRVVRNVKLLLPEKKCYLLVE